MLVLKETKESGHTFFNLVPPDFDVVVSVGPRLLMIEPQSMEQLMLHYGLGVTPRPDGQILPNFIIPDIRPASKRFKEQTLFKRSS